MEHEALEQAFSRERFARYLAWAGQDRAAALDLYALNTRVSESLYTPLQTLEVVLRNRIHSVLVEHCGPDWFEPAAGIVIGSYQAEQVQGAIDALRKQGKEVTAGGVVSGLTFSFWTTMFHKDYEALWQQALHRIAHSDAPRGLKRKSFSGPLTQVRLLRNRIAHHEPVLGWDLRKHHARMFEMLVWLSPAAADWCGQHDRFAQVHRAATAPAAEASARPSGTPASRRPDRTLALYAPQVSRRVTLRLNTGAAAVWSRRSATK
ncbi:Abi family protein [Stenotrophomonas panacihumi]|uniref:Abi family protein n=1 Tax=Stenotrophomonas panacihumi TaxID=676599 RepID=UPI000D3451A1|nr:Abi family protein [Stenotrophomonas panacihumi]PTN55209.1 hypothetical protein C9J98_05015 [Stenotrophomonas panacihumi]